MKCENCKWYMSEYNKCLLEVERNEEFKYCTLSEKHISKIAINTIIGEKK